SARRRRRPAAECTGCAGISRPARRYGIWSDDGTSAGFMLFDRQLRRSPKRSEGDAGLDSSASPSLRFGLRRPAALSGCPLWTALLRLLAQRRPLFPPDALVRPFRFRAAADLQSPAPCP